MYTSERADWWINKSQKPAHQKAHGTIAFQIVPGPHSVIIDCCCGNGELVKRICTRYKAKNAPRVQSSEDFPLIIGTDISEEMLTTVHENLRSAGIEATVLNSGENVLHYRGPVLVKDNLTNSTLPAGIGDITCLIFPELHIDLTTQSAQDVLTWQAPESLSEFGYHMAYRWLAHLTKKGKNVIVCDYSDSHGKDSRIDRLYLESERSLARRYGLHLIRRDFVSSPEIFEDIDEERRKSFQGLGKKLGYRVLLLTKV